eukprot:jgi/Phyca11/15424/fgenesh1_pg.PHYCAscaffold_13_\
MQYQTNYPYATSSQQYGAISHQREEQRRRQAEYSQALAQQVAQQPASLVDSNNHNNHSNLYNFHSNLYNSHSNFNSNYYNNYHNNCISHRLIIVFPVDRDLLSIPSPFEALMLSHHFIHSLL